MAEAGGRLDKIRIPTRSTSGYNSSLNQKRDLPIILFSSNCCSWYRKPDAFLRTSSKFARLSSHSRIPSISPMNNTSCIPIHNGGKDAFLVPVVILPASHAFDRLQLAHSYSSSLLNGGQQRTTRRILPVRLSSLDITFNRRVVFFPWKSRSV